LFIVSAFAPIGLASGGPMDSAWPMLGHDAKHTGRSPYSTANNHGELKWTFETYYIDSSPVIDNNGTIYISAWNTLYALNPNGTEKWQWYNKDLESSSPALAEDGTLYIGLKDGKLYAINPNGTVKWSFKGGSKIYSSPAIEDDGTIYIGVWSKGSTSQGVFYAINPNGTEKWRYNADFYVFQSPAIGDDGTVYFASHVYLYAFNPNGTLIWSKKIGFQNFVFLGSPTIGDDGIIYIPRAPGPLYALYPNGTIKWTCAIGGGSLRTPAIGYDGTIYIGGLGFHAINPDGTKKWTFIPFGNEYHEVDTETYAISKDGTIYIGTERDIQHGQIFALNSDGAEKWRYQISNDRVISSPVIAKDGTVYIAAHTSHGGIFYAFGELDADAPSAPIIDGSRIVLPGKEYKYTFKSSSPLGNDIYYYIDWGDGKKIDWIGPYPSGEEINFTHTWSKIGRYTVRARAKDTNNLWGPWGYLDVNSPRDKIAYNTLFLWFLEQFPILSWLLQRLI
jgi:outer membrane protein assembly factor BamB